jgi:hypothetical protein
VWRSRGICRVNIFFQSRSLLVFFKKPKTYQPPLIFSLLFNLDMYSVFTSSLIYVCLWTCVSFFCSVHFCYSPCMFLSVLLACFVSLSTGLHVCAVCLCSNSSCQCRSHILTDLCVYQAGLSQCDRYCHQRPYRKYRWGKSAEIPFKATPRERYMAGLDWTDSIMWFYVSVSCTEGGRHWSFT